MKTEGKIATPRVGRLTAQPIERQKSAFGSYRRRVILFLILADAISISGAAALFHFLNPGLIMLERFPASLWLIGAVAIGWAVFASFSLYNCAIVSGGVDEYARVFSAANLLTLIGLVAVWGALDRTMSTRSVIELWGILMSALLLDRFLLRRVTFLMRRFSNMRQRTLIVGAGAEGAAMARQWQEIDSAGVEVIGFVDDGAEIGSFPCAKTPVLGKMGDLEYVIHEYGIDSIFLAEPRLLRDRLEKDDRILEVLWDVELQVGTGTSELLASSLSVREEGFVQFIVLSKRRMGGIHYVFKTIIDYVLSLALLAVLFPLFAVLFALIRMESEGAPVYRRRVVGLGRKEFDAFKFRTMHVNGNSLLSEDQKRELNETGKLKDDPRITKVGAFIRKLSIDELPQLLNVVRGEMSLIGPRMITLAEMEKFGRWQHTRTLVKPGLTGLWQVSGRSDLTYEDRARLDVYYVRNFTIWLDLRILLQTIPAVVFRKGAY